MTRVQKEHEMIVGGLLWKLGKMITSKIQVVKT
jgi:hypothetical protein